MTATQTTHNLLWPKTPIDPAIAWVTYDVPADEFILYFGGEPVPAISDLLAGPRGFDDVAVMVGIGPNNEITDDIVGVHVIPMLLGAVQEQPHWAILTWAALAGEYGEELLGERLPAFLDEIAAAYQTYGTLAADVDEHREETA